jgi:hypothetical protein
MLLATFTLNCLNITFTLLGRDDNYNIWRFWLLVYASVVSVFNLVHVVDMPAMCTRSNIYI